jgi:hypothetical protein
MQPAHPSQSSVDHSTSPATTPAATATSPAVLARVRTAPLGGGVPEAADPDAEVVDPPIAAACVQRLG